MAHREFRAGDLVKVDDSREKIAEVIKWLYINDNRFESAALWRQAFVKFLEETL